MDWEAWAERAAILEFEAGMTREEAEKEATRLLMERKRVLDQQPSKAEVKS